MYQRAEHAPHHQTLPLNPPPPTADKHLMTATQTLSTQANAYLKTRVMTASPEELRLMLLDGAARFLRQGIDGLEAKDYERSFNGISQCRAIIMELLTGVRPEQAPELVERVQSLYSFLYAELVDASFSRDVKRLGKVLGLIEFERETWQMAMQKVRAEREAAGRTPASEHAALAAQG